LATLYNAIQGRSLERLAALSDGIFAVAMTLLVLDLHIPSAANIHSEAGLGQALAGMAPQWIAYLMSFLTLGIFWAGQQTQLNHIAEGDRDLTWIHLAFLFAITSMPLSTRLLAEFITYRLALVVYWLNILLPGAMLYWSWTHAMHKKLVKEDTEIAVRGAICRRVLIAQSLYAFGAALCVFSNCASIGFIVLVQLNYAIAPRFGRRLG
jgi:uncharacterized membrane protein